MLLSDMWQPAVLQLLPFSSNDACTPVSSPTSERLRQHTHTITSANSAASYSTRGFPVLAVTRSGNGHDPTGSGHDGTGNGDSGSAQDAPTFSRAASERLSRSTHTVIEPTTVTLKGGNNYNTSARYSSDYPNKRSAGVSNPNGRSCGTSNDNHHPSYNNDDDNDDDEDHLLRAATAVATLPNSSSSNLMRWPGAGVGSPKHSDRSGGAGWGGIPRPGYPSNALSSNNCSAAAVIGSQTAGTKGEGHFLVSKNGLWRTVTLTPGELELKKHREQLDSANRVTSGKQQQQQLAASSTVLHSDSKLGRRFHKVNVRDLPRSTTPVNDHDPDKLNMKQVIAFLQSKGKSQAEAMELPREVKVKVTQEIQFPKTASASGGNRGHLRGSIRRPAVPMTASATELCLRASMRHLQFDDSSRDSGEDATSLPSSSFTQIDSIDILSGGERGGGKVGAYAFPPARSSTEFKHKARKSARAVSEYVPRQEHYHVDRGESSASQHLPSSSSSSDSKKKIGRSKSGGSKPQEQKKPFRLHRFLTMVPSPRDVAAAAHAAQSTTAYTTISARPANYTVCESISRTDQKERTLCLDLANQSKAQANNQISKADSQAAKSADTSNSKLKYRVSATDCRSRPSSLREGQDSTETHNKLSTDCGGERVNRKMQTRNSGIAETSDDKLHKEESNNVIRLPFVMVDSEDEEANAAGSKTGIGHDHKRGEKSLSQQSQRGHRSAISTYHKSERHKPKSPVGHWAAPERDAMTEVMLNELYGDAGADPTQSTSSLIVNMTNSVTRMNVSPLQSTSTMTSTDPLQSGSSFEPDSTKVIDFFVDSTSSLNAEVDSALSLSTSFVLNAASSMDNESVTSPLSSSHSQSQSQSENSMHNNCSRSASSFALCPTVSLTSLMTASHSDVFSEKTHAVSGQCTETRLPAIYGKTNQVGVDNIYNDLHPKVNGPRKVKVTVPSPRSRQTCDDDVTKQKPPDCVTLSLRKERHRTRESTYMSEIGGRNALADNVRPSSEISRINSKT